MKAPGPREDQLRAQRERNYAILTAGRERRTKAASAPAPDAPVPVKPAKPRRRGKTKKPARKK